MPSPTHGAPPPPPVTGVAPHVEHTGGSPSQVITGPHCSRLWKEKPPIPTNLAITQESGSALRELRQFILRSPGVYLLLTPFFFFQIKKIAITSINSGFPFPCYSM